MSKSLSAGDFSGGPTPERTAFRFFGSAERTAFRPSCAVEMVEELGQINVLVHDVSAGAGANDAEG